MTRDQNKVGKGVDAGRGGEAGRGGKAGREIG